MNQKKIGELIRAARREHGFTQQELAAQMHISDKTISKWECGLGCPDLSLLPQLSEILGLDSAHAPRFGRQHEKAAVLYLPHMRQSHHRFRRSTSELLRQKAAPAHAAKGIRRPNSDTGKTGKRMACDFRPSHDQRSFDCFRHAAHRRYRRDAKTISGVEHGNPPAVLSPRYSRLVLQSARVVLSKFLNSTQKSAERSKSSADFFDLILLGIKNAVRKTVPHFHSCYQT